MAGGSIHIAALGSSFAAGPGIPPKINLPAGRSGANYAHILAERLGARLTDLSVSGATLKNVSSEPQVTLLHKNEFAPQIEGLPDDVDVVTITAGWNDLGYIGSIMQDTLRATFLGRMLRFILGRVLPNPEPGPALEAEDVKERFVEIIDSIRQVSPGCRILLVEYLTLFGRNTRPGIDTSLDEMQIKHHQDVAHTLQNAYRLAAEARPESCKVIPIADLSQDHDIGSREPWVEGFSFWMLLRRKAPFHPNAKGMRAVADVLYKELKSESGLASSKG
jgi:lysophospholipase L1-like esterase